MHQCLTALKDSVCSSDLVFKGEKSRLKFSSLRYFKRLFRDKNLQNSARREGILSCQQMARKISVSQPWEGRLSGKSPNLSVMLVSTGAITVAPSFVHAALQSPGNEPVTFSWTVLPQRQNSCRAHGAAQAGARSAPAQVTTHG